MSAVAEQLHACANRVGVCVSHEQIGSLTRFIEQLQAFNAHTNLVAKADTELLIRDHIADALSLVGYVDKSKDSPRLVDIGSGAGFPAVILAIALPQLSVELIESIGKKCTFLQQAVDALDLASRVRVHNQRAELLAHQPAYREQFDFATARAVGKLDLVAELSMPFLRVGGHLLAQKSRAQAEIEWPEARKAVTILGGTLVSIDAPPVEAVARDHVIVLIRKERSTLNSYPRPTAQLKRSLR
jgi:16S rRNA (guanine527-N7)-methyltransferase